MEPIQIYFSPEFEMLDLLPEGVICGSFELDMDPEEGYM
jgi:hypothetical protein